MKTIFKSLFKKHFFSFWGIFLFVLLASSLLCSSISVRQSASLYESDELSRIGFGDITFWITKFSEPEKLIQQISTLEKVENITEEHLIFADYEMNHKESDSEAQLVVYDGKTRWLFFDLDGRQIKRLNTTPDKIESGSVWLPLSMISDFQAKIEDTVQIVIARNGVRYPLKVTGFFEDPIAGSTMIGMKTFLISLDDYESISDIAFNSGIDALARKGLMIHVTQKKNPLSLDSGLSDSDFVKYLNEKTLLSKFTEQVHSKNLMQGFMLLLHNIFSSLIAAFTLVLFVVIILILIHTIKRDINADKAECGILKELGYESTCLSKIYSQLFLIPLFLGVVAGFSVSFPLPSALLEMTATSTGLLIPLRMPVLLCFFLLTAILALLFLFTFFASYAVKKLSPLEAIKGLVLKADSKKVQQVNQLHQKGFYSHIALRQILSSKKAYLGVLFVSLLLTFFSSMVIRLNSWLGPNGEGLMDAFNPADHHLGVQSFGQATRDDFEKIIQEESEITGYYTLAMPMLRLNSVDYKANVISNPDLYHILRGKTCSNPDEIVLTEFLLSDLALSIGDTVEVSTRNGSGTFTISGTYQCANDMGSNFGMNREGFLLIGEDNPAIWCHHYFLKDGKKRISAMQRLEEIYGTEIHVHENAWPGLYSIISAMKKLLMLMFAVSAAFIILSVTLCAKRTLADEVQDLGIYSLLGWRQGTLRLSFAFRFVIVSLAGAIPALFASGIFSDPLANLLMKTAGISGFDSNPSFTQILLPPAFIVAVSFIAGLGLYSKKEFCAK